MDWQGQHPLDAVAEQARAGLTELGWQGFSFWLLKGNWGYVLVAKQGGQLVQCKLSNHRYPLLWLTDKPKPVPAALRGGVPVCWPWFSDDLPMRNAPAHGLARTAEWTVVEADGDSGLMQLQPMSELVSSVKLTQSINVGDDGVSITLNSHNGSDKLIDLTQALHSYLAVSDAAAIELQGLASSTYADKLRSMAVFEPEPTVPIPPYDRIYRHDGAVRIVDAIWQRALCISKTCSDSTIVWNPGEQAFEMIDIGADQQSRFVCIEAGNVKPFDPLQMAVGASANLTTSITVEVF